MCLWTPSALPRSRCRSRSGSVQEGTSSVRHRPKPPTLLVGPCRSGDPVLFVLTTMLLIKNARSGHQG